MKRSTAMIFSVMLFTLLLSSSVLADVLTLNDCIELALKNRESIVRARGYEELAGSQHHEALGAFLPRVDASYRYSSSEERDRKAEDDIATGYTYVVETVNINGTDYDIVSQAPTGFERVEFDLDDQDRSSTSYGVNASWAPFDPSKLYDYKASGAWKKGAHLDVINSEQDLIYAVKGSYYGYLATVENASVQEQAVERAAEQLKLIESKYELGSSSKSEVLKQKVQYGNDQLALLSAQHSVVTARAGLAYTIGVDPGGSVEFSTEYSIRGYEGTLEEAVSFAIDHEPGLLSAQKSQDAAKYSLTARKFDYLPKLAGYGSITWSDGSAGFTSSSLFSSRTTSIGFSVNWSIFDGFSRERRVSSAKVNKANADAAFSDARNLVVRDVKTAYLEIEQRNKQQTVAMENVEAAEEDLKITQEKYKLGAATILDLLNAQVSLKQAQVSRIRADFDLNTAVARLENAMGKM